MAEDYLNFIGAIIGGGISGAVGLLLVWYTNRLQGKERLKDNVYRKLYGYVFELHKRDAPNDSSVSIEPWTKLEAHELIMMNQKIKKKFDTFATETEMWNKFCRALGDRYYKHASDIKKIIQDAFSQSNLLNANGNITIKGSNSSVEQLLQFYLMVILNPDIKDSETLFKMMAEFVQKYYSFRADEITYLKENKPLFFDILIKQLPYLRQIFLSDFDYADMMIQRDVLKTHIAELTDQLEKLAK